MYGYRLSWLGTDTWFKSCGVNLVLNLLGQAFPLSDLNFSHYVFTVLFIARKYDYGRQRGDDDGNGYSGYEDYDFGGASGFSFGGVTNNGNAEDDDDDDDYEEGGWFIENTWLLLRNSIF